MIVGIDIGLQGAIAAINKEGKIVFLYDMPTFSVKKGKSSKLAYDVRKLCSIILEFPVDCTLVFIEKTQALPFGYSVQASWSLGRCEGLLHGMLMMKGIRSEFVRSKEWQKYFKITKEKGTTKTQSYEIASQLFPDAELKTPRGRKLDGRSDALLIAEWGRRHLKGEI